MRAMLGLVNGLVTTLNTRGDKSPAEMGRAKRGGLQSRVRRKQLKLTLAALGCVILFGLVSLSVFWLISRQTMQVQVPHGYLVVSDGILDMPSGKLIYRFPQAIRPYVLAHPDADDNWNIYEFEKNSVVVYHLNKSTHAMSEVHRVDISKIYQSTRQFYSSEIDASGLVLAMPSSDAKSYYFISLNKEAEVKARNFERVFPCESRDCFWVLAGNSIRRYDFRNDSTENWGILPSQPSAFFSSVSPNGRYFLSVKHDRQGFIGLRRSEYKIEVYDFASNRSSSFRVSGWGFIEKVMFLDSKHALLVFGFPLMGYWEIKVIDVTQERHSTWKTFRSPISVYRYIPTIQVSAQGD